MVQPGEYSVAGYGERKDYDQKYAAEANFDPAVKFAFGGDPELQAVHQEENPKHFAGADQRVAQLEDDIAKAQQEIESLTVHQKRPDGVETLDDDHPELPFPKPGEDGGDTDERGDVTVDSDDPSDRNSDPAAASDSSVEVSDQPTFFDPDENKDK